MKSSKKILIGVLIIISLLIGFFIGITVDYPKTENSELAGTIGKMDNYRNVKISEKDVQLRNDLLSNESFLKGYLQYYSAQYTSCVKQCEDIDFAIKAAESAQPFKEKYAKEISDIKQYSEILKQSREDILLALTSLQNLAQSDENAISQILNLANVAIAQIKYSENCLFLFVESVEKFIQTNNSQQYTELLKAHDLFAVNQLIMAAITNDKPMLKAYDKKQLLSSNLELNAVHSTQLNSILLSDFNALKANFPNNEKLQQFCSDPSKMGNIEKQLGVIIPAFEKLGGIVIESTDKLRAVNSNEKLGLSVFSTEKLNGALMNGEKLGIQNTEILRVTDLERLRCGDAQKLGTNRM